MSRLDPSGDVGTDPACAARVSPLRNVTGEIHDRAQTDAMTLDIRRSAPCLACLGVTLLIGGCAWPAKHDPHQARRRDGSTPVDAASYNTTVPRGGFQFPAGMPACPLTPGAR